MVRQGGRSGAIVAQDGRGIVASQLETLEKASRLRVQVLGPDPVTSLLDGYSQSSIDNYFLILKVLSRSCPRSAEAACDLILPRINGGLLSLLQLSVVCGLFSMEIAEVAIARLRGRDRDELEVPGAIERFNEYLGVIDEIKAETDRWMRLAAR